MQLQQLTHFSLLWAIQTLRPTSPTIWYALRLSGSLKYCVRSCSQLDKLDDGWRDTITDLRLAVGLRNRIIHGYDAVDDEVVFETVQRDLAGLRSNFIEHLPTA